MTTYVPWFLQEDGQPLLQEDGNTLLIDGEIDTVTPPPPPPPVGDSGRMTWDEAEKRMYETGLDRGVLYIPDGPAVPWNGLTAIVEKFEQEKQSVYYDGMKINELVALGDFAATMKAVTYPDEFTEIEGMAAANPGMFLGNQSPKSFALSYRTKIGSAIEGHDAGYKIHILYNVTAIPSERTYASLTDQPTLVEFEWDITAIPEEVPGFRPTAHIIINSIDFDVTLLGLLEDMIYGKTGTPAYLLPMADLINYLNQYFRVRLVDNGDGTWSAFSSDPSMPITFLDTDEFQITGLTGSYLDADTYIISSTTS